MTAFWNLGMEDEERLNLTQIHSRASRMATLYHFAVAYELAEAEQVDECHLSIWKRVTNYREDDPLYERVYEETDAIETGRETFGEIAAGEGIQVLEQLLPEGATDPPTLE